MIGGTFRQLPLGLFCIHWTSQSTDSERLSCCVRRAACAAVTSAHPHDTSDPSPLPTTTLPLAASATYFGHAPAHPLPCCLLGFSSPVAACGEACWLPPPGRPGARHLRMLRRSSSALAMGLWDNLPSMNGSSSSATTTTTTTTTLPPSSAAAALAAGAASLRAGGGGVGGGGHTGQPDAFSQFAAGGQTAADVLGARAAEVGANVNDAFRGGWAAVARMAGVDDGGAPADVEACANGATGQQSVQQVRLGVVRWWHEGEAGKARSAGGGRVGHCTDRPCALSGTGQRFPCPIAAERYFVSCVQLYDGLCGTWCECGRPWVDGLLTTQAYVRLCVPCACVLVLHCCVCCLFGPLGSGCILLPHG